MRIDQEKLRLNVKISKAYSGNTYKAYAEYLGIEINSFYNWLHGQYELSEDKAIDLEFLISDMIS